MERISACESISCEKREKYQKNFIDSFENDELLKEKPRFVFMAASPLEECKNIMWFIFSNTSKIQTFQIDKGVSSFFEKRTVYFK